MMETTPVELTPQLRQMNHYWRLLASLMGELTAALEVGDLTAEERLARVRELREFARAHMGRAMPRSVVAEDAERRAARGERSPEEITAEFWRQLEADGRAMVHVVGEDGELHEDVYVPSKGQLIAVIDDDWSSQSILSPPAMAWLHAEVERRRAGLSEAERLIQIERVTASGIIADLIERWARRGARGDD
jgi:hypothetical protein